jgi:hypothetical protein
MVAKKTRVTMTVDASVLDVLNYLSKKEQKSISRVTGELVLEALEEREDILVSEIAEDAEYRSGDKETVFHKEAWK